MTGRLYKKFRENVVPIRAKATPYVHRTERAFAGVLYSIKGDGVGGHVQRSENACLCQMARTVDGSRDPDGCGGAI